MMSDAASTTGRDRDRDCAARLDLTPEYAPDDERQARALLLMLGFPADEIERVVGELALESDREM